MVPWRLVTRAAGRRPCRWPGSSAACGTPSTASGCACTARVCPVGAGTGVGARLTARVRRWFAGLGFRQMWQLVVLLVLAATAAFGGLDDANTAVTVFEPGQEFSDGQYTLTVERASVLEEIDGVLYDDPESQ